MTAPYTGAEVRRLLARDEGQLLEFKSLVDRSMGQERSLSRRAIRDMIAETIAAFANADGGVLVLCVEDDGTLSGHRLPDEAVAEIGRVSSTRLDPGIEIPITRLDIDGHELLVLDVPMTAEALMVRGNGFPYRVGDAVVREPQEVINQRKQSYRRVGYEQRLRADASIDDLDLELAQNVFGTQNRALTEEHLVRRGLLLAGRRLAVTNSALLLLAREPLARWHPRAGIRLFRVQGTARRHGENRNVPQLARLEAPLVRLIPEVIGLVSTHVRVAERLEGARFAASPEYPEFAWQEAIINAVAHRDYAQTGQELEIWFYHDRLEVRSPGELVPPITVEQLNSGVPAHWSRNPLLVGILVELDLMREEGEWIPRMIEEMRRRFLYPPLFQQEAGMFSGESLQSTRPGTGRSVRRHRSIRQRLPGVARAIDDEGAITNAGYRTRFGVTRYVAARELRRLVNEGYLILIGEGRGARYEKGPRLDETLRSLYPQTVLPDRTGRRRP